MKQLFKSVLTLLLVGILLTFASSAQTGADVMAAADAGAASTSPYDAVSDADLYFLRVFRVTEDMTFSEFIESMVMLDDKNNTVTDKFLTLCYSIPEYYLYGITFEDLTSWILNNVKYVDFNNIDALFDKVAERLDRFSYYVPASMYDTYWTAGSFKGMGVIMEPSEDESVGGCTIKAVIAGSPAEEAGILMGDRIVAINKLDIGSLGYYAAAACLSMITADADSVTLGVMRGNERLEFQVELRELKNTEFYYKYHPEIKTLRLCIDQFIEEDTCVQITKIVGEYKAKGCENIILDLRYNPGGVIEYAIRIANLFVSDKNKLYSLYLKNNVPYVSYYSNGTGYDFDKIYILTNEYTASAAEMMTSILVELEDAVTIGKTTYGKGVGQSVMTFDDNSSFAITTIIGYTPEGFCFNHIGLRPQIEMDNALIDYDFPVQMPDLNKSNYETVKAGASNNAVLALEMRLEVIGYMMAEDVDGVYDETTALCIRAFQYSYDLEQTGVLDYPTVLVLNALMNEYQSYQYYNDDQMDYVYAALSAKYNT